MKNAKIWKSIEALCDEAEAIAHADNKTIEIIGSTAPPLVLEAVKGEKSDPSLTLLQSNPPPAEIVYFQSNKLPQSNALEKSEINKSRMSAMAEIAAAVENASNPLKKESSESQTPDFQQNQKKLEVDRIIREQIVEEVNEVVRTVVSNELPNIVQKSLKQALVDFVNTTKPIEKNTSLMKKDINTPQRSKKKANKENTEKRVQSKKSVKQPDTKVKAARPKSKLKKSAQN